MSVCCLWVVVSICGHYVCFVCAMCCQAGSFLVSGFMSRACLCLMWALCCQDVSSLGRGVHVS